MEEVKLVNENDWIDEEFVSTVCDDSGCMHGVIYDTQPRKITPKDGRPPFTMVDIYVKSDKGQRYKKSYSVDFMRKILNQLKIKMTDVNGLQVFFKQKDEFRNISSLNYIGATVTDAGDLTDFRVIAYINEKTNNDTVWKELGLM